MPFNKRESSSNESLTQSFRPPIGKYPSNLELTPKIQVLSFKDQMPSVRLLVKDAADMNEGLVLLSGSLLCDWSRGVERSRGLFTPLCHFQHESSENNVRVRKMSRAFYYFCKG